MIRLSEQSHASFSRFMKALSVLGFIAAVGFFGWTAANAFLKARSIQSEQQLTEAVLSLEDISEERGKRGTRYTFHFWYAFEVDGNEFSGQFSTSEDNAEKYIDQTAVTVAYKSSDPSVHERLSIVENNTGLWGVIKRLLIALPLLALLAAAVYALFTQKIVTVRDQVQVA